MGTDFSFDFRRTSPLGAAEAAPADADALIVWDLPDSKTIPTHELPDSLLVLVTGATIAYELAIWDATSSPAAWFVIGTGTLVDGVPTVIPFAYRGARIYLRRTNVTLADVVISVSHRQLGAAMSGLVLSPLAATAALQTAGNASLTSIDGKVATAAKQDTGNGSLASIDGKITACNTGAVTVSVLPATAATAANQSTEIGHLAKLTPPTKRAFATFTLASDPHDLTLTPTTGGFIVSITGEYKLRLTSDSDAEFTTPYLLAGVWYPGVIAKIWATGSPVGAKLTGYTANT